MRARREPAQPQPFTAAKMPSTRLSSISDQKTPTGIVTGMGDLSLAG